MVKVSEDANGNPLPCSLYLDGYEKTNLDLLNKKRLNNWDVCGSIVGPEGDGKTRKAAQVCLYMDHKFSVDNIVFTPEQFLEAVNNKEKFPDGSSILWDESDALGDHWASKILKTLTKTFKRIRKRNLFILLVTPTFFDFNKYFAIHRMQFLYHVYSEGLERGYFRFFSNKSKRLLFINGKKTWDMSAARPNFLGRFTDIPKGFPIDFSDDGEYETKKDIATASLADEPVTTKELEISFRRRGLEGYLEVFEKMGLGLTQQQHAEAWGVDRSTIAKDLKAVKEAIS